MKPLTWKPCWKKSVQVEYREQAPGEARVSTREGITPLRPDDLIIRGVSGEEYPIGRDIFAATYSTTPPDTAEIDALRARVAEVEAERDKAAIRAHLVDVAAEHESAFNLTSLAASQAEARELRGALKAAWPTLHYYGHKPGEQHVNASPSRQAVADALDLARAALATAPGDDTALREVCRKVAMDIGHGVKGHDGHRGCCSTPEKHATFTAEVERIVNRILGQPGDDAAPTKEE